MKIFDFGTLIVYFGCMFKLKAKILLTFLSLFYVSNMIGQIDPRKGDEFFKIGNYFEALEEYKKQIKLDRDNDKLLIKLAQCYLNTNIDKAAAIPFLERAVELEKFDPEALYFLGIAYTHNSEYEKAIEALKKYKQNPGKHEDEIDELIKSYELAIGLMQKPVNVTFHNMGNLINTEYPDYYPFVTKDEKTMAYTSRRPEGKGSKEFDGYYPSDIYVSTFDGLNFSEGKNSGSLNTAYDEQCVGIYDDGSQIFVYIDNFSTGERGNIYLADKKGNIYGKKNKIKEGVNSKDIETSASISSDGNSMLFASNRSGGAGGLDIYMIKKLPNGKFGMPQNLSNLNTPGYEDFPVFSPDGQTIYFSSNGLPGMGGFDLYKSKWDEENMEWGFPENLGYPLNTSYDEKTISFADDEKHAYISTVRKDGIGDLDIYRITFEEVEVRPALFIISLHDAISNEKLTGGIITIFMEDEDEPRTYLANKNSQEFSLILNPGKYELEIEADGIELTIQELVVSEFDADLGMIKKEIKITK